MKQSIEERLLNSGKQTKEKIESMRREYELSLKQRMNSPSINKKSRDKKYSSVPFYERLYTPRGKNHID